ncbi:MAG TPA: fatty acid oxidation complex subunit alpha FadJ [Polyangia bacterium]|jgi:3-hydroxyacyl-CoA dehydrogenase/enoyl-CoA hydratase/3-hydroxybutyryl-CoA epimerase
MSVSKAADPDLEALRLTIDGDGVATLSLDVPGASVNALTQRLASELEDRLAELSQNPTVRAVVFVSGKPDSFIVGADLNMLSAVHTMSEGTELSRRGQRAFARVEASPVPVVAAIHGPCLGGGLEAALCCTARVASDDPATVFGTPEVMLGLIPGAGGTQRLPRLIGVAAALDLLLTGRNVKPRAALKLGLVDEIVPKATLFEAARARALALAAGRGGKARRGLGELFTRAAMTSAALEGNPVGRKLLFHKARRALRKKTRGNYPAPERILEAVRVGMEEGREKGYEAEARYFGELLTSDVARRLIEIFFAREALKKDNGVDDPAVRPHPVGRLGVLGGGLMGGGIALCAVQAGLPVRLKEKDDAGALRALRHVRELLDKRVARRRLTALERDRLMGLYSATTDLTGFRHADLVVEAVFEDLGLKQRVLRAIETVVRPECVFASNTSSLPIGRIAEASSRPETVVGMHFFSPVHKMPLLEVIGAPRTADWVVATAVAAGKRLGKTVIVVGDGVGFYTSRILAPLMNEAAFLLSEGAAVEAVDGAMMDFGFPVGPIQLLDEVGIDVAHKVGVIMVEAFGERLSPPPGLAALVDDGRLGRKSGRGFYTYDRKKKTVDASVYALTPQGAERLAIPAEEIQERCALAMVNEAARCLAEGVLRTPRDGDIGAVFGLGFPPFRGGPFRYADALGAAGVVRRLERFQARHGVRFQPAPNLVDMARTGARFHR